MAHTRVGLTEAETWIGEAWAEESLLRGYVTFKRNWPPIGGQLRLILAVRAGDGIPRPAARAGEPANPCLHRMGGVGRGYAKWGLGSSRIKRPSRMILLPWTKILAAGGWMWQMLRCKAELRDDSE